MTGRKQSKQCWYFSFFVVKSRPVIVSRFLRDVIKILATLFGPWRSNNPQQKAYALLLYINTWNLLLVVLYLLLPGERKNSTDLSDHHSSSRILLTVQSRFYLLVLPSFTKFAWVRTGSRSEQQRPVFHSCWDLLCEFLSWIQILIFLKPSLPTVTLDTPCHLQQLRQKDLMQPTVTMPILLECELNVYLGKTPNLEVRVSNNFFA